MSSDSEEPGESKSDISCRCAESRGLSTLVETAIRSGVHFQDPFAVYIDPKVVIESGAWIGAGSQILGTSRIGSEARIGPNAIISDSTIGAGAEVQPFSSVTDGSEIAPKSMVKPRTEVRGSYVASTAEIGPNALLEQSRVASGAKVGPFCRVRSGSDIGADAYVGTQAEVKASQIGQGSKIGHFSFLGDARVGRHVNIGAGSVTANFDGSEVQQTIIEDDVSIGAGSVLIAPVRLGIQSRTGAGAIITRDVEDGDLVLGVPARVKLQNGTRFENI